MNQLPKRETIPMGWSQPDVAAILIDDTNALMMQSTFDQLRELPISSTPWVGRMWRTRWKGAWYLSWNGPHDTPGTCSTHHREIVLG